MNVNKKIQTSTKFKMKSSSLYKVFQTEPTPTGSSSSEPVTKITMEPINVKTHAHG